MSGPLTGVNILDVGTAGVGPWAVTLLGYLGANIVKLEGPAGDFHLGTPGAPGMMKDLFPIYTIAQLNKLTAAVDLKDPKSSDALERLIRQADIVSDNLRPGAIDRMGVGYERIRRLNPAIISASSPAWGEEGPMRNVAGLDPQVQMLSGFASLNGELEGRPERLRYPHLDFNASCFFAASMLLALVARERTGQSQRVTSGHLGSNITLLINAIGEYLATGIAPAPNGSASTATAPHQLFRCRDGLQLAVGVESDEQWARFCTALGHTDWLEDTRFASNRSRVKHREELATLIQAEFGRFNSRWWVILLEEARVPHSHVYDFDTMLRFNQQILENEYLVQVDVPHQGKMYLGGLPWEFEKTSLVQNRFPPPAPGQYTDQVMRTGFGTDGAFRPGSASQSNGAATRPLEGLRVIEATQGVAGPFAGLLLAEAGADVIKVEASEGDYARRFAPEGPTNGDSAAFAQLNRNKKGITINLASEAGQAALRELVRGADVFLEDWGPGVADGLGFGYDTLSRENPSLVYYALSAHGEKGPLRDLPTSELAMQAWTEFVRNVGQPQQPQRVGAEVANIGTGVLGFVGILAAIYHKLRTGDGQRVSASMLGTVMCLRTAQWSEYSRPDSWGGMYCDNTVLPPQYGYETKDAPIFFMMNFRTRDNSQEYYGLLKRLGMYEDVKDNPHFRIDGEVPLGGGPFAEEVRHVWERYLSKFTAEEAVEIINAHGGMAAELLRVDQLFDHPQIKTLRLLDHDSLGNGYVRAPWLGSWEHPAIVPAPALAQDTDEILSVVKATST